MNYLLSKIFWIDSFRFAAWKRKTIFFAEAGLLLLFYDRHALLPVINICCPNLLCFKLIKWTSWPQDSQFIIFKPCKTCWYCIYSKLKKTRDPLRNIISVFLKLGMPSCSQQDTECKPLLTCFCNAAALIKL